MGARQNRQGTQDGSSILLTQKDIFSHKLISFSYLQNKALPTYGTNYIHVCYFAELKHLV